MKMTSSEALELFYDRKLSINIFGASAGDFTKLKNILGLKWRTGEELDAYDVSVYTSNYVHYIHDNLVYKTSGSGFDSGINRGSLCRQPYGQYQLTMSKFLALFENEIEENEFVRVFNE